MNRREEPLSVRARKKVKKIVKSAVETETSFPTPRNTRGQNPACRPRKNVMQEAARLKALKKVMESKKKNTKSPSRKDKRTGPGAVEGTPSAPAYPHKEGKRWMQTVEKQTLNKARLLRNKIAKRRPKG